MKPRTTSEIAKILKLDRDKLFRRLIENNFIERVGTEYILTEKGISKGGVQLNGVNKSTNKPYRYPRWSDNFVQTSGIFSKSEIINYYNYADTATEGEKFLAEYFDIIYIEYKPEFDLNNKQKLINDVENYRRADFYLPRYEVYVEFAGKWNRNDYEREKYNLKRKIFSENKIPCVWIYPDNLGAINYFFHKRIEQVLIDYSMTRELKKYRLDRFGIKNAKNFLYSIFAIILIAIYFLFPSGEFALDFLFIGLIILVHSLIAPILDLNNIIKNKPLKGSSINNWEY